MSLDWDVIRAEFPAVSEWTYLNSATFGQLPRRGLNALLRHWKHREDLACTDFLDWFDDAARLRALIAQLIGATAEDIAFVPNATAALGIVAGGFNWAPGDNVVTLGGEFPNYLYLPALMERHGVEFREVLWERFFDSIDEKTRLVALSEVNYSSGFRPPLEKISQFLRDRGVVFFVDGTQSVGALRFDAGRSRPDALAVHGYKWLCSPTGAGFLYVAPELRTKLAPTAVGWRSHRDWRAVDNLHHGTPVLEESAEKYEGGGLPFPLLYAMQASVELMLEIGPQRIEQRVLDLAHQARAAMRRLGADAADTGSQIVAARFPGVDPSRLVEELKARRILVAARHGYLRVSPHFYNNGHDLARLEEELKKVL